MRRVSALTLCVCTILAGGLITGIAVQSSQAFPKPALVPRAWEFEIEYGQPRPVSILDDEGLHQWYWYMPYTVSNNSREDRLWVPEFTIAADSGEIVTAGSNIPASVYPAIARKERNKLMVSPIEVVGKLLQGDDYAKTSVAIWPVFEKDVDRMDIFIAGLSGETFRLNPRRYESGEGEEMKPAAGAVAEGDEEGVQEETDKPEMKPIILRKTLMISYETPGTDEPPQKQVFRKVGEDWVMR